MVINKTLIILDEWEKGSEINKRRLAKYRLLIESFACSCMERLEEEINSEAKE